MADGSFSHDGGGGGEALANGSGGAAANTGGARFEIPHLDIRNPGATNPGATLSQPSPAAAGHARGPSRAAVALLEDFGRVIGLPSLYFGDDDCCWLDIGETHIACIATLGETGFLRLHAEVAELPPERDAPDIAAYLHSLLARNATAVTRGEALPFAIDPRRNALVLTDTVPLSATGQALRDAMERLLDQLTTTKRNPPPLDGGGSRNETAEPEERSTGFNGARTSGFYSTAHRDIGDFNHTTHLTTPPPASTGEFVWRI